MTLVVDQIELANQDNITIGQDSDINFQNVPKDYLIVWREGNRYGWKVNDQYHDSLQYFKINNANPNRFAIINDDSQRIIMRLPTSYGDTLSFTITGKEVWKTWVKRFRKQKEVMARHFAANYRLAQKDASKDDSTKFFNQMQRHDVRSFFSKDGNTLVMVILDELTQIQSKTDGGQDTTYRYVRSGYTSDEGEKANHCKVQFFTVGTHCYLDKAPESGTFQIDGVNYVMKASVKLTEWGAGHVMISSGSNSRSIVLSFPKPVTFVGTVDTLSNRAKNSSDVITLKQSNNSFPNKSDLFLPSFSNAVNFDLCNIEFFHKGDSTVVIRDNNFNTILVKKAKTSPLPFPLVPTLERVTLGSGNNQLHARVGYIDQGFFLSYLWLPLIVLALLLLVIWYPRSVLRISDTTLNNSYDKVQLKQYRGYLSLLLLVFMVYCVCKSLITIKLSYTYPYFEKLTGIIPVSTSLMLLIIFSMAMVLNFSMLHMNSIYKNRRGRLRRRVIRLWLCWAACAVILLGLMVVFFMIVDRQMSYGMLRSYFDSEVFMWKFWNWPSTAAVGVNDTHRSVVYTLSLVEVLILLIWGVMNLFGDALLNLLKRCVEWWRGIAEKLTNNVQKLLGRVHTNSKYVQLQRTIQSKPKLSKLPRRLILVVAILVFILIYSLLAWMTGMSPIPKIVLLILGVWMAFALCFKFVYEATVGMAKVLFPSHMVMLFLIMIVAPMMGNFGTAFITLCVVIGLSSALSLTINELSENVSRPRYSVLTQMLMIVIVYTGFAMVSDNGYMTNFLGFAICTVVFYSLSDRPKPLEGRVASDSTKHEKVWVTRTLVAVCVIAWLLPWLCSYMFNPENVNYSRMNRRVMLYSNFDELQRSGYRYSESDAEFMVIMSHYMQGDSLGRHEKDPLSNDSHFMHPSVSSGQSPVALNDLSVPIAFFGSYGSILTHVVYFSLLALLLWIVMRHTLFSVNSGRGKAFLLTRSMQWRMMAMFMWFGTSLYIYFSYIDWLPFTGRLIPGFGVDSVGEALETSFLLAFMGTVTSRKNVY